MNTVTASKIKMARVVAITADALQIALFPLVVEGFISPLDDALDIIVCVILTYLLGWHYAFLPSFVVKVVPMADMVPTWTIAVFLATRPKAAAETPATTQVYTEPPAPPRLNFPSEK